MEVSDTGGYLTASQKSDLEAATSSFHMKVKFVSAGSIQELRAGTRACVTSPSTICMSVDPVHRQSATEFGTDTGISPSNFAQVARAGNPDFKDGHWVDGVKAVSARATVLSQKTTSPTAVILQQPVIEKPVPIWPFALGLVGLSVLFYAIWRRNKRKFNETVSEFRTEADEMRQRNINEAKWAKSVEDRVTRSDSPPKEEAAPPRYEPRKYYVTPARAIPSVPPRIPSPVVREVVRERVVVRPDPIVVAQTGPSFTEGLILGEMLSERRQEPPIYVEEPRTHHYNREVVRDRTPEPVFSGGGDTSSSTNDSDGGDASSFDDSSGGGDDSSF